MGKETRACFGWSAKHERVLDGSGKTRLGRNASTFRSRPAPVSAGEETRTKHAQQTRSCFGRVRESATRTKRARGIRLGKHARVLFGSRRTRRGRNASGPRPVPVWDSFRPRKHVRVCPRSPASSLWPEPEASELVGVGTEPVALIVLVARGRKAGHGFDHE